ncbi:MAG: CPBP family intramembrane glutamic endopeptidase [Limnochordia bacterium]
MLDRRWLAAVAAGWFLLGLVRAGAAVESGEELLVWMLLQQLWLIVGSWLAVRQASILRWDTRDIAQGALVGVGLFAATSVLNLVTIVGLSLLFPEARVQQWLLNERSGIDMLLGIENAAKFCLAAAAITLGASVSEELFFRGAILTALCQVMPVKWAVFLGALVFACVHFYLIQFIPVLLSGIALGYLYLKRKNLSASITAHLMVNALALAAQVL